MIANKPIYSIAKDLSVDSNKILLACKTLGIIAKGSAKRKTGSVGEHSKTGEQHSMCQLALVGAWPRGPLKQEATISNAPNPPRTCTQTLYRLEKAVGAVWGSLLEI